jgi:hypothetical protein
MAVARFTLKKDEVGKVWTFAFKKPDKSVFPITGYTVVLQVAGDSDRTITALVETDGTGTYANVAADSTTVLEKVKAAKVKLTKGSTNLYYVLDLEWIVEPV